MKTFITGIAKCDWIAVYLTKYDISVVNRPLEKCTIRGVEYLDEMMKDYDVAIDPYFPLFQDKIIEMFPDANWIFIDAPIDQADIGNKIDPAMVKEKFEYLTGKVKNQARLHHDDSDLALSIVKMLKLDQTEVLVWWNDLMESMKVTYKGESINESPALAVQVEPLRETPNNEEMQKVLKEMCSPQPEAYEVLTEMWNFALLIDHIYDNDGVRKATVLRALKSMFIRLGLNPFYQKNCAAISLAFVPIIAAWEHSNTEGASKVWGIELYASLPALFAYIIGQQSHVDYYMPKIHKLLDIGLSEDELRDQNKK